MEYRPFGVTLASDIPRETSVLRLWKAYRLNKSGWGGLAQGGREVHERTRWRGTCDRSLDYLFSAGFGIK